MAFPTPLAPAPWPPADEGAKKILGSVVYSLANLEDATVVAGSADGRLTLLPHSLVLERISGSSTAPQLAIIPVAASAVAAICPVAASSVVLFVAARPSCFVSTRRTPCALAHCTDPSGHDTGAGIVDVANPGSLSSLEVPMKSGPRLATAGLPDVLDLARLNDGRTVRGMPSVSPGFGPRGAAPDGGAPPRHWPPQGTGAFLAGTCAPASARCS